MPDPIEDATLAGIGGVGPPTFIPVDHDPFEIAAYRTRQSVRPEEGRQIGLATRVPEAIAASIALAPIGLYRAAESLGRQTREGTLDPTNPETAGEAFNLVGGIAGARIPFTQAGELGAIGGGRITAQQLRERLAAGKSYSEIGDEFDISRGGIASIVDRFRTAGEDLPVSGRRGPRDRGGMGVNDPERQEVPRLPKFGFRNDPKRQEALASAMKAEAEQLGVPLTSQEELNRKALFRRFDLSQGDRPVPSLPTLKFLQRDPESTMPASMAKGNYRDQLVWADDELTKLRELHSQGKLPSQLDEGIDEIPGRSGEAIYKMARKLGLEGGTPGKRGLSEFWKDEDNVAQLKSLREQGNTWKQIGDKLGISDNAAKFAHRRFVGGSDIALKPIDHDPFSTDPLQRNVVTRGRSGRPVQTEPFSTTGDEQILEAGSKLNEPSITAFHGSPYDFDKFDFLKIGSGEGAAAYGHGGYFAENEAVARKYRDDLAASHNRRPVTINVPDNPFSGTQILEADPTRPGKMYQVRINANPEHFLDWDKPLSEQSEHVHKALPMPPGWYGREWALNDSGQTILATLQNKVSPNQRVGEGVSTMLRQAGIPGIRYLDQGSRDIGLRVMDESAMKAGPANGPRGPFHVYQRNGNQHQAGPFETEAEANAWKAKEEQKAQTHNYVVFDDRMIDIMKKYGIAGLGALPAAGAYHFQTSPVDHNPFGGQ